MVTRRKLNGKLIMNGRVGVGGVNSTQRLGELHRFREENPPRGGKGSFVQKLKKPSELNLKAFYGFNRSCIFL
jgi:hypothetical protein